MTMAELGIQIFIELQLLENDRQFTVLEKNSSKHDYGLNEWGKNNK